MDTPAQRAEEKQIDADYTADKATPDEVERAFGWARLLRCRI